MHAQGQEHPRWGQGLVPRMPRLAQEAGPGLSQLRPVTAQAQGSGPHTAPGQVSVPPARSRTSPEAPSMLAPGCRSFRVWHRGRGARSSDTRGLGARSRRTPVSAVRRSRCPCAGPTVLLASVSACPGPPARTPCSLLYLSLKPVPDPTRPEFTEATGLLL